MAQLKASEGRIVVQVNVESKNFHTFSDGTKIRLERKYNNFNLRYVNPCNGIVLAAENVPVGSQILFQYNAIQETFRVYNYKPLSGQEIASDIHYYSIPSEMAYAYLDGDEWKPIKPYAFGLRVFRPYSGILQGIEPTQLKDTLYVRTGELAGKIVKTLKSCDYCIVYQEITGKEGNIIVFKHYEDQDSDLEEVICIMDELTEQLNIGDLLIGIDISTAKTIGKYEFGRNMGSHTRI